jgi:hypothetical protein
MNVSVPLASPDDFIVLTNSLTFTAAAPMDCVMVNIIDDLLAESSSEQFIINLGLPETLQFQLGTATVTITDNDGKIVYSCETILNTYTAKTNNPHAVPELQLIIAMTICKSAQTFFCNVSHVLFNPNSSSGLQFLCSILHCF